MRGRLLRICSFLATAALVAVPSGARAATHGTGTGSRHWITAREFAENVERGRQEAMGLFAGDRASRRGTTATRPAGTTVSNIRQIAKDTLPPYQDKDGRAEHDTLIEPDVDMDPNNPNSITAVYQQGRFQDGGSEDPGYSTSHDGGRTWTKGDLPGLTTPVGGPFDRASDAVVAYGPDGAVYAQTIAFDAISCNSAVSVQRSDDGGLTFGAPKFPQNDVENCAAFNDKNWMTVDTYPDSPYYGRIYMAWDRISCHHNACYEPEVLRYSDDRGETWSPLINISGNNIGLADIGVIPVVEPNGDVVVVYDRAKCSDPVCNNIIKDSEQSQTSHDGGKTWADPVMIGKFHGVGSSFIRTGGLPTAAVDPVTGAVYAAWQSTQLRDDGLNDIVITRSNDEGQTWGPLHRVNHDAPGNGENHFTPTVAAYGGIVHVTYNARAEQPDPSNFVDERYARSNDGGNHFGPDLSLGAPADLRYAAEVFFAHVDFLGDYMGLVAGDGVAHAVWCRSFADRHHPDKRYNQSAWTATIQ